MEQFTVDYIERRPWLRALARPWLRSHYRQRDLAADEALLADMTAKRFVPDAVLVQIARVCNLRCTMCGWAVWQRNKGFMSLELYERILGEVQANGIKQVNLTNPQGEPLLSPHAVDCVKMALDRGLNVYLNTNCTPLSRKNIPELVKLAASGRLTIQASFSGYDKKTHEQVYVGSKFELTSEKLQSLNAALKREGLERHMVVNGIIMDRTTLAKHLEFLASLGIERSRATIALPDNFAGIVEVGKKRKGMFSYKQNLPYRELRLCGLLAHYILIYDDGQVSACSCRDSEGIMTIGDITKESLFEIRNGPRYKKMLASFMRRDLSDLPLCRNCDIPYGDHENIKLTSG